MTGIQHFKSSDGLNLAFRDGGEGLPVLCLAGVTRNSKDFDYLAESIDGCRLIRPDYRGRGYSDYDPDPLNYSVQVEARDALELLDHLSIDSVSVIGTSRGGMIAMFIAATAKHRLTGVLLNDIGPDIDPDGIGRICEYIGIDPCHRSMEKAADETSRSSVGFSNVPDSRWRSEAEHRFKATPDGPRLDYDSKLRDSFLDAVQSPLPDLWPFFKALDGLPAALVRGANSDLLSSETAAKMREILPDMIFRAIPDRGHCPFLDEPESLSAIREFLKAVQAQA